MKEHHCVSIVPLFNHLTEEEQNQVESLILHRHFRKGETVWQPGEDPLLIIVAKGSMKVYMLSGSGREQLLRKTDFNALLLKTPSLALKLLEMNAQRMADTENQTRFLMMEKVETRLASYLTALSNENEKDTVEIHMKMKDLSAYLGTTPETLSRKLHLLEEKNIIRRKGKKIEIMDREKLREMAEE